MEKEIEKEYRYTDLTGEASIRQEHGQISVKLFDKDVNPDQKELWFDIPIDSDPRANPPEDGSTITTEVKIMAGLNRKWFEHHTTVDGFRFRNEEGGFAEKWEDLEEPEKATEDTMDPIKPEKNDGLLQGLIDKVTNLFE